MANSQTVRNSLAVLTALIAVACLTTTVFFVLGVSINEGIPPLLMDDVTTKSIDARLILAQSLFQVALLMVGALWGIVIAKPGEIQLVSSDKHQMLMFASASIVLLVSIFCYGIYLNKITGQFAEAVRSRSKSAVTLAAFIPDVFDQNVNYLFKLQFWTLVAGIVNGVLTLVSAYRLTGDNHENQKSADCPKFINALAGPSERRLSSEKGGADQTRATAHRDDPAQGHRVIGAQPDVGGNQKDSPGNS